MPQLAEDFQGFLDQVGVQLQLPSCELIDVRAAI